MTVPGPSPLHPAHAADIREPDGGGAGGRARRAVRGCWRAVSGRLTYPARMLPGVAAVGCAVAGSWWLWNVGVALLVAVPFLLLVDARTPRG
jgi:hypothetical protein